MIDKLEIQVPESVPKRIENWQGLENRFAGLGMPYTTTLNADREYALRIHHGHQRRTAKEDRHCKVDFTDTRLLSAHDLLWRLTMLFQVSVEEAQALRVMRIDFAADVSGVPVEWFRRHSRVKGKRTSRTYGTWKTETTKGVVTGLVFGKRPDLYRIYNRVAEKLAHSKDILQAGLATGASAPIVTRVERQCTGKAIPKNLSTLGGLIEHAADADPLPALVCSQTGTDRIAHDNWPPRKWLMSLGLAAAVRDFGEAEVLARLNRSGGNAKRVFDNYSDLLLCDSVGVTEAQLRDEYRRGTIRQLNVPVEGPDGEITYPAGGFSLTL